MPTHLDGRPDLNRVRRDPGCLQQVPVASWRSPVPGRAQRNLHRVALPAEYASPESRSPTSTRRCVQPRSRVASRRGGHSRAVAPGYHGRQPARVWPPSPPWAPGAGILRWWEGRRWPGRPHGPAALGCTGIHARLSGSRQAGTRDRRGRSVAVRGKPTVHTDRPSGWTPSAYLHRAVTASGSAMAISGTALRVQEFDKGRGPVGLPPIG
jgi:hypothetical protein